MLVLVISACMIDNPSVCKDARFTFEETNVTPQQCMFYGQQEMSKWLSEHPNYRIMKWRCDTREQKDI